MSATSGGGGSVSEGSEAGGSSQSTMSVSDSPSTSFQANLAAENVTKITLSDENNAGGYTADVTGSKINLTLDERQQKDGIVNVAFDYEEGGNSGGSGIVGGGMGVGVGAGAGSGGGDGGASDGFRSMNGSEKKDKVPEAVNLELVNMVPYSNGNGTSYGVPVNGIPGIPMKKDSEQVDMSTAYDEYFVPVNEHKKYMRGEKLYVTKDKRRPTSWRRCLSWIVACTVISVVLIVAILAGTGVILSQEPDLVRDSSVGRNFAGSNSKPSVTDKSLSPTAEKLMYVPRSIESEFVIDNLDFDPALRDLNSSEYQQFASNMENQLKMFLFDKETFEFGASDVGVKVVNISRDPFKVNYRIGWNYKQGVNNPPEPIKMEDVKKRLVEHLARNQGYIDKYHIDREAIKVGHVINACEMENGGCSHICYYNYITQQFTCTCPTHLVLDSTGKNCVVWSGSEDDAVPIPSHGAYPGMPYESTANPVQEYELKENIHSGVNEGAHHHREGGSHDSTDSDFKGHLDHQHGVHEPTAEPVPEPTAEPGPGQTGNAFGVDSEAKPEPIPNSDGKQTSYEGHDHDMHSVTNSEDVHSHYDHDQSNIHSSGTIDFGAAPEPTAEPTSGDKYHDYAVHSVYGSDKPEAEPSPEPGAESTGSKDHVHMVHSSHESTHEPSAEPTPEPVPEPAPEPSGESSLDEHKSDHSVHESKDHEPVAEPSPGRDDHDHIDHSVYELKDHEPSAEPTPEPAPEPTPEPSAEDKDHDIHSSIDSKGHEPVAEPTSEPAPEPNADSKDHIVQILSESGNHKSTSQEAPESQPEPTPEPSPEDKDHTGHSLNESKDHEPSAEPTPEPVPGSTDETRDKSHSVLSYESKDKPATETATESSPQDHNGEQVHFMPMEKDGTEPVSENSSDVSHNSHGTQHMVVSEDNKSMHESTRPEDNNKEHDGYSIYETRGGSSEPTGNSDMYAVDEHKPANHNVEQTSENSPKQSSESEPSDNTNDHQIHVSNTGEHMGSTSQTQPTQDGMSPGSDSSVTDSNQQPVPHEGRIEPTELKTEYSNGGHPNSSIDSQEENKSGHHLMPHLQDVLIRRPDSDLNDTNATSHDQDVLRNVELNANGEPIIEEILIDKPHTKEQHETGTSTMTSGSQSPTNSESDHSNPATTDAAPDHRSVVSGSPSENSSDESAVLVKQSSESDPADGNKVKPSMIMDNVTGAPANAEQSTIMHLNMDTMGHIGNTESPKYIHETLLIDNQNPTGLGGSHFNMDGMRRNPENETNSEHSASGNLPQTKESGVTIQPEVRDEYQTIPVGVQFLNPDEESANKDGMSKEENHRSGSEIKSEDSHTILGQPSLQQGESSTEITRTPNGDSTMAIHNGDTQTQIYGTTTESHIPMTTLLSILSPGSIEMKINGQLADKNETEMKGNATNKSINTNSQSEANETTELPEEFSNNIKDELLDNDEFNTLIDKEYKNKEGSSTDGKELLSKYPNKAQKVDKKKIKDYVKGERVDFDKKAEVTAPPAVTPEDFILQKHVNGHENTFDLEYSHQNEPSTKHDGGVTIIDPTSFDRIPGVSFNPHGINNHDLKVLQTVAPDFRTETIQSDDLETQKLDSKVKSSENKEGEFKLDKDYPKFEKDYKYEKQKGSKKKDLKKKGGSGKDGKNFELDDGRRYYTEISKEDIDFSPEVFKDTLETTVNPSSEKMTIHPETGVKMSGSTFETSTPEYKIKEMDTSSHLTPTFEMGSEEEGFMTRSKPMNEENSSAAGGIPVSTVRLENDQRGTPIDQNYHQIIDEPSVKTTSVISPGTVYDEQSPEFINTSAVGTSHTSVNPSGSVTYTESRDESTGNVSAAPGTVFDGITGDVTSHGSTFRGGFESSTSKAGVTGQTTSFGSPTIITSDTSGVDNNSTANPTIIIHGQSGSLQNGHNMRFANSTFFSTANATGFSGLNGTFAHPNGNFFTITNHTTTYPNGSVVHPTIVVRGQSGTIQDGHVIRFGNGTFKTVLPNGQQIFNSSTVYRIENGSLPGTYFKGQLNPHGGQNYTFSNSSGTFFYSNTSTTQPQFIIRGESGDFGNSRAYIMTNGSGGTFSKDFTVPSVIFRNSTVFAVENTPDDTTGAHEAKTTPQGVTSNDTINYTRQVSPNFFSTGTAYQVNNYFGYISKCAAGQFQCVNGTSKRGSACISLSSKCDSINDCSDGSDELGCIENGCPGNFQCSDGSCLKRNLVCNGILDCSDGSDEKQCESWKCEFDEFQCPSGRCIPVVWQCDGKPDCDNHTDEYNCQTSCGNDEYLCPEGWCVPLTYKCNGVKECSNGEDEQLCDCSHEEFKCQTGGCVSMTQVCDGLDDCPDRSDEWDCVKLESGSNLLKIRTASGKYEPVCADNWTSQYSDDVCTSLGYFSSVPTDNENSLSTMTETSFFTLKNDSTGNFNKKVIVNLKKSEGNCSSGKMVEISCQEFTCGSRSMTDSSSVEARLVGGMGATAGQWPSVALVYNIRNYHSCTANVLTPRWVLVSYNCLKMGNKNLNEQDWKFFGGSTVFETERENAETRKVVSIIPHPQVKFNQFLFSNDLALVELDQSLQFTSNLGAVCLPEQEMQPRQICVTAGWGMNTPEDKSIRQQLQYLPVPTMNLTECNSTEHYSGFITDDKICAGYNSAPKSLCYNEEGAPLMCVNDRGDWELQGVLSYHSNCGRGSHPSIFSSITPVADWIKKTIGNSFERKTVNVTKR